MSVSTQPLDPSSPPSFLPPESPPLSRKRGRPTTKCPKEKDATKPSSRRFGNQIPKPDAEDRPAAALRRLGVEKSDLDRSPKITEMLKRACGSVEKAIEILRFSDDKSAAAVVEVWDDANQGDRKILPMEAFCLKADVPPPMIFGLVLISMKTLSAQESALTTMIEHPEVVRKTIAYAKDLPGATKDREMIHQAVGYLPTSKGISMAVNLMGTNAQLAEGDDDDEAFAEAFPSLGAKVEEWSENRRKLLNAGK